jgi:uncharacterized protein (TIGR02679 family)
VTLPSWLTDPALGVLWRSIHEQLERRGLDWRGWATVEVALESERRSVGLLLGRVLERPAVTVDVAELDARLANAGGLVSVLTAADGPLQDKRSIRALETARRAAPVTAARELLPEVAWSQEWLAVVRRVSPTPDEARRATRVLRRLLEAHEGVSRQDLAAGVTGNAHALDEGTALSTLVLRGLALACGTSPAETAAQRRDLWGAAGVRLDAVSTTCLVHRLPLAGGLGARLADGEPLHVTARDLRRSDLAVVGRPTVLVCENPRVLEAVADAGLVVPVICSSGSPNLVVMDLLQALAGAGATLRYHGDFDWPGLAIANRLVQQVGAQTWLMDAAGYTEAASSSELHLAGKPALLTHPWAVLPGNAGR